MAESEQDPSAEIERIYRSRYGKFLRVAVAIVRDEQLAEEAVHDAFVRALRHQASFGRGSLEGWLWRIVINESRRRDAAERQKLRLSSSGAPGDAVAASNGHHDHAAVAALVAALPER